MDLPSLIREQGWTLKPENDKLVVVTPYEDTIGGLELKHPVLIHLEIFGKHPDAGTRYKHLKAGHDILWPTELWHEWTERRFMAFAENHNYIGQAGGAATTKSYDTGKFGILFFWANPRERNVTVASVTLASLKGRVWGYIMAHMKSMKVPLPYVYRKSNPPCFLFDDPKAEKGKVDEDPLHGIFAVTAKVGDDDQAVATWIGKHPKDKLLVILDEATDMPISIFNALPNLEANPEAFQLTAIGNSDDTSDLHGIMCTPENGWDSISTELISWKTIRPNGICLYFNPYQSPAITHPDEEMRKKLGKFLITKERLDSKEKQLGKDSEQFYRWTLGFWKSRNAAEVVITEAFLEDKDFYQHEKADWSGLHPIRKVAALDPAFSTGGDKCVLRIGEVGHTIDNKVKVNLGDESLTYEIKLIANENVTLEKQIGLQTILLMKKHGVTLENLAVDVTGQGRAIAEVIVLLNQLQHYPLGFGKPLKIYSMSHHNKNKNKKSAPDIVPFNSYVLWTDLRSYIEKGHVAGIDTFTQYQLSHRKIITTESKGKRVSHLESKMDYKKRMSAMGNAHSPDQADAAALLVQVVKLRLGIEPGAIWTRPAKPIVQRVENTMVAHVSSNIDSRKYGNLESDFSGSLIDHVNFSKPF